MGRLAVSVLVGVAGCADTGRVDPPAVAASATIAVPVSVLPSTTSLRSIDRQALLDDARLSNGAPGALAVAYRDGARERVTISDRLYVALALTHDRYGVAAILAINRLSDADVAINVPPGQLAVVLVAGVVLGFVAAWLPARRSTRLDVLDAIQAT